MKIASLLLVLPLWVAGAAADEPPARETVELLDAPGGKVTAVLFPGTPMKTVEQRAGYARVTVEGWIRIPPGTAPAPQPIPPSILAPPVSAVPPVGGPPALSGRIDAGHAGGSPRMAGAYARVVLLPASEELEREREALVREYGTERTALDQRIRELEAKEDKALNSSDNMTEAARRADRFRAELDRARQEVAGLETRYEIRGGDLYRKYQLAETTADPAGRYAFPSLPPGRYRLAVAAGDSGRTRHWFVPADVPEGGGGQVDLTGSEPEGPPF